jgi:PleD family two-component response regulator
MSGCHQAVPRNIAIKSTDNGQIMHLLGQNWVVSIYKIRYTMCNSDYRGSLPMLRKLFRRKKLSNRVLLVEDDALLARVLADSLKAEDFDVVVVDNGLNVYDQVLKFSPDIILLDLIIPGIDGFAVLKQLQQESKTKGIPVVVVSNLDQPSDVKSVKALGAEQFFLKANTKMEVIVKYVKNRLRR